MRPYDLVTFDCYGTLIDWESGIGGTIDKIARERKVTVPTRKMVSRYIHIEFGLEQGPYRPYREVLAIGLRLLFEELGMQLTLRQSRALVSGLPRWPAFPETKRVLQSLRRAGYRLAVLSNVDDALLRQTLRRIGGMFDYTVTSQQVGAYKPSTKHWERVLALSKTPKHRVLHVGTSQLHDIIPAKSLGFRCAWINRHRERILGATPEHSFASLSPLTRLLVDPQKNRRGR